jgi:MFS family permease
MAVMFTVGAVGLWMMGNPAWITALMGGLISAFAGGGIQSLIPAIVGDHVDRSQTSRSLSFIFTVGDVGSALGPMVALNLVSILSISRIYQGCALFFLGLMLFWIMNGIQKR